MPQYMLLIYPPVDVPTPTDRLPLWQDYTDSLRDVIVANGRLEEVHAATTVEVRDGETLVSDGPFAETKEYLGGFYLIDVEDLDTALAHAARMPVHDYARVEVRPMMFPAGTPAREMAVRAQA